MLIHEFLFQFFFCVVMLLCSTHHHCHHIITIITYCIPGNYGRHICKFMRNFFLGMMEMIFSLRKFDIKSMRCKTFNRKGPFVYAFCCGANLSGTI